MKTLKERLKTEIHPLVSHQAATHIINVGLESVREYTEEDVAEYEAELRKEDKVIKEKGRFRMISTELLVDIIRLAIEISKDKDPMVLISYILGDKNV